MLAVKYYFKRLLSVFKQGISPKALSLSVTICLVVTVFPFYGLVTIILTSLALRFKLNLPLMLTLSYLIEPLKLVLIIPFINLGASIVGLEPTFTSLNTIQHIIKTETPTNIITFLSVDFTSGILGWFVIVTPLSIIFYFGFKWVLCLKKS
jgi:uncharacterized protein (DUF2062 family)